MPEPVAPHRIGLVGYGKIARDQHLPAIAADPRFELVAIADPVVTGPVASFAAIEPMLAVEVDAVVLCQPPAARHDAARLAIAAGKHVFLEKPPAATLAELDLLERAAAAANVTLFTAWHSRAAAGSQALKPLLRSAAIESIDIVWRENVRVWHPGQRWLWQRRGFGVFDPGINALSILTDLVEGPMRVTAAELEIPANQHAPIAARLQLALASGAPVSADFDFRETGSERWEITVRADGRCYRLTGGGARLSIDGIDQPLAPASEYATLYAQFAALIADWRSSVDDTPLRVIADSWLIADRLSVAPFDP